MTMLSWLSMVPRLLYWILSHSFWTACLLSYILWLVYIIVLAVFGLSAGIRRRFVDTMINVFEQCRNNFMDKEITMYHRAESSHTLIDEEPMIDREVILSSAGVKLRGYQLDVPEDAPHPFHLMDAVIFARSGIESIIEDEVTTRFQAEEIPAWNLLTRTTVLPQFISWRMNFIWLAGVFLRYVILFPFRLSLFMVALSMNILGNCFIGMVIPQPWKGVRRFVYRYLNMAAARILMRSFSAVIRFHNKENRAKGGGICVANHTSPIDTYLLGTDNCYALVGQLQGGLFGMVQWAFNLAQSHVWFNRAEASDRTAVARRLREHVADKSKMPILIFPEGTCINNTSIMMFKKGSFETGGVIYPAAIKYDPRFADAFWNSSKYPLPQYLLMLMTSWALVADITYLPPQTIQPGEDAISFANRVKADIARAGGLVDLDWDGGLKRSKPKVTLKLKTQRMYSETIEHNHED